jgi:hypothetical protein
MSKSLLKYLGVAAGAMVILFSVLGGFSGGKVSLGSEIHFTQDDFKAGIKVDGTEVINSSGVWVGGIDLASGNSLIFSDGDSILDNNGNEALEFGVAASAVNYVKLSNAATGNAAKVEAVGGDTDIDLELAAKGDGFVDVSSALRVRNEGIQSNQGTVVPMIFPDAPDTRADAGAVSVATYKTYVTTTGAAAITLADGVQLGQIKKIQMTVDGGDATLTPATFDSGTTVTFADVGDTAELVWLTAANGGWLVIDAYNTVNGDAGPVAA